MLECIATFQSDYDLSIDETCQHQVYLRKSELTMNDNNVYKLLEKSCPKDLQSLKPFCKVESQSSTEFSGKYLSCIFDNREVIKGLCSKFKLIKKS